MLNRADAAGKKFMRSWKIFEMKFWDFIAACFEWFFLDGFLLIILGCL
jgi:hypothetical protein